MRAPKSRASATHSSSVVSPKRHERDDVDGTHARVLPLVDAHVDPRKSLLDRALHRSRDGRCLTRERQDAPVVIAIRCPIKQMNASRRRYSCGNGVNDGRVAAFAEVRNAFHESCHLRRQV